MGVQIYTEKIIYHLFDRFKKYIEGIREGRKNAAKGVAVFPVELEILAEHIFRQKNPIVLGCLVRHGTLRIGTPLCAKKENEQGVATPLLIGVVSSIEIDNKQKQSAKVGEKVAVKMEATDATQHIMYGRHFDHTSRLISHITRASLDAIKEHFWEDLTEEDKKMLFNFKSYYNII